MEHLLEKIGFERWKSCNKFGTEEIFQIETLHELLLIEISGM